MLDRWSPSRTIDANVRALLPVFVISWLLAGCLDWSTRPPGGPDESDGGQSDGGQADGGAGESDGGAETPACPERERACHEQCGQVLVEGCAPYECPACACTPFATCDSIGAECGSLVTECGT